MLSLDVVEKTLLLDVLMVGDRLLASLDMAGDE